MTNDCSSASVDIACDDCNDCNDNSNQCIYAGCRMTPGRGGGGSDFVF